jgi:hypothetical protein
VAAQEVGDLVQEPEAERGYVGPLKHPRVEVHVPVAVNRAGGEVASCGAVGINDHRFEGEQGRR